MVPDFGQGFGDWRLVGYAVLVLLAILVFPGGIGSLLDRLLNSLERALRSRRRQEPTTPERGEI